MTDTATIIARLKRRLARRDARIAGLEKELTKHQKALAAFCDVVALVDRCALRAEVTMAVTDALRNVRMIPVFGQGQNEKIIEVRAMPATEPIKEQTP